MFKEIKKHKTIMSYQIENINRDIRVIKKTQIEILNLKVTISEIKNLLEKLNSNFELAEDRIRSLR